MRLKSILQKCHWFALAEVYKTDFKVAHRPFPTVLWIEKLAGSVCIFPDTRFAQSFLREHNPMLRVVRFFEMLTPDVFTTF